jgi:ParB family chromosome partitioning protein
MCKPLLNAARIVPQTPNDPMSRRAPAQIKDVPLDLIRPGSQQARRQFNPEALNELAESIRESGVVQPVVLRTRVWGYEILAGERRWRAAQIAGLREIPAVIRDDLSDDEAFIVGLIENLQRESLTPLETAAGLKRLLETYELKHEDVGKRIGKSREYVTNYLRLLNLSPPVQTLVNEGHILLGHAKILAGVPVDAQIRWADEVIRHKLTVRALEKKLAIARDRAIVFAPSKPSDWRALERDLADHLACPVELKANNKGRGELRVKFHSLDELDGILARIGYVAR